MKKQLNLIHVYLITLFGVISGASITPIIAILVKRGVDADVIAFYRLFFISLLMFPLVFCQKKNRSALKNCDIQVWMLVGAYSVTKAVTLLLWTEAIRAGGTPFLTTTVGNLSLIFVMLFSYWFFKEKTPVKSLIGIAIALIGVGIVAWTNVSQGLGGLLPVLYIAIAAASGAANTLLGKVVQKDLPVLPLITLGYGLSGLLTLGVAIWQGGDFKVDWISIGLLVVLGCFSTLLSHSIPIWAVKYARPTTIQVIGLPLPFFTAIFSFFLLGQIPSVLTFVGSLVMAVGLGYYLITEQRRLKK